ncbi:hypothetical protein [Nonomuraea salmonea]
MFVFGAVITPGGDPLTMMALAMPMILLYFVAEGVIYLRERRGAGRSEFDHLSDDEASPLAEDDAPVGTPAPAASAAEPPAGPPATGPATGPAAGPAAGPADEEPPGTDKR